MIYEEGAALSIPICQRGSFQFCWNPDLPKRPTHVLPRLSDKTSAPPNPLSVYLFIFPPYPKVVVEFRLVAASNFTPQ